MDQVFTPREIDTLIPQLEKIFHHAEACQRRIQVLASERPAEGTSVSAREVADAARVRSQMEFLLHAIQEDIGLVAQLGGVVKDVAAGLVDFPGRIEGQDVWLCWKRGEEKVNFWHPLYAGYSERRIIRRRHHSSSRSH